MNACPRCGGVLELVADGSIGLRPAPFLSCNACEFCEEAKAPKLPTEPLPSFPSEGLAIVTVTRIDPLRTANPRVTDYIVHCQTLSVPPSNVTYTTINAKYAAVCGYCLDESRPAAVSWKRTRWGLKIVGVEKAAAVQR